MKRTITLSLLLAVAAMVLAVPAKPGVWRTITLQDGTKVKAELKGDEYASWWQTESGGKYVKALQQPFYKQADMDQLMLHAETARAANPLPFHKTAPATDNGKKRVAIGGDHPDFVGSKKGLIILVEFADQKFAPGHDAEYYSHIANDLNFTHPDGFVGSIRDYFRAQSNGKFDLTFDIVGPVTMKNNLAYYGSPTTYAHDCNPQAMVREAVQGAVKIKPDFSEYDWFGDGLVDQVFVIYAGRGEANGGHENSIWPHRSSVSLMQAGGKFVNTYACSNEMRTDTEVDGIGAFCHEFSHCLGLADIYDTSYDGSYGMSSWDIMHSGNYLENSFRPCSYTGYERAYCGWIEPIVLNEDTSIKNMKSLSEGGECYYIYNDAYKKEFYVLENRTQTGWDQALPGSGLIIAHMDFDSDIWKRNLVNTVGQSNDHQRYTLFPADNRLDKANAGQDAYPYQKNNLLSDRSQPASTLYHPNAAGIKYMSKPVTNITRNGDGTISFDFQNKVGEEDEPLPAGCLFRETFNLNSDTGGNDGVWSGNIATGAFLADNDGWASSKKFGAFECARFGTNTQRGIVTSPEIEIDGAVELSFLAAPWTGEASSVSVSIASGTADISETSFALEPLKWTKCKTTIEGKGKIKVEFRANKARFFLDEVFVKIKQPLIIGDVNSDGAVDSSDVSALLTLILNSATAEDEPAADVNQDGKVDINDVVRLVAVVSGQ